MKVRKTAVVTGAGSGIGRQAALALLAVGGVALAQGDGARHAEAGVHVAVVIPDQVAPVPADLGSPAGPGATALGVEIAVVLGVDDGVDQIIARVGVEGIVDPLPGIAAHVI